MKDFLARLPIDLAKFGVALYLLGLFTSAFYFSQYGILALDLARPQAVLIGVYIFLFYGALPASILLLLKDRRSPLLQIIVFCLMLCIKNAVLMYALDYRLPSLCILAFVTSFFEFLFFAQQSSLLRSIGKKGLVLRLSAVPSLPKAVVFTIIFSVHFALFIFPFIPSYLGGARPLRVHIYPKTTDLPLSRFADSKNNPQINPSFDSFEVFLIYESDKDLYFVEELPSEWGLEGYSVMRLKKDEILRIDYPAPRWVSLKGVKK